MDKDKLKFDFYDETGIETVNTQGEPDIEYVDWLEKYVIKLCNLQNVISRLSEIDKYDIWFDTGSKFKREGIRTEMNNDDGDWIKADEVKAILNGL